MHIENSLDFVPFVYPLMIENENLRQKLIENKVYIAKYWNEVLNRKNVLWQYLYGAHGEKSLLKNPEYAGTPLESNNTKQFK